MSYRTISLPSALVGEVEKNTESMGYSSIAEFVKDAVRRRLDQLYIQQMRAVGDELTRLAEIEKAKEQKAEGC